MQPSTLRLVGFSAATLLALAVLPWPYGYYRFLRLAATAAACILAYEARRNDSELWMVAFIAIALLFNPIFRIPLEREVWSVLNVICAVVLVFGTIRITLRRA